VFQETWRKELGSVGQFCYFFIQFHSHLCMLYVVLYRGWQQINMYEVCKCFVLIEYTVWQYYLVVFSVPTPPSSFCRSVH